MSANQQVRRTSGNGQTYDSILDTVGNTPVIRINNLAPEGVELYVKAEFFNPMASVKDRLALNIIEAAERSGALQPGQTVVEATSGNTGIGLAMVCAQKGYPLVVTMAINACNVQLPERESNSGSLVKAIVLSNKMRYSTFGTRRIILQHFRSLCRRLQTIGRFLRVL